MRHLHVAGLCSVLFSANAEACMIAQKPALISLLGSLVALCSVSQFHFAQRSLSKTLHISEGSEVQRSILMAKGIIYSFPESLACFSGNDFCNRHAPKRCGCRIKLSARQSAYALKESANTEDHLS